MSRHMLRIVVVAFVGLATAAFALAQRQPSGGAGTADRPRAGAGAGAGAGARTGDSAGAATAADRNGQDHHAKATFEVYKDKAGEYRWRLRATNTQILAIAAQGYSSRQSCMNAIQSVKRDVADAPIEEKDNVAQGKEDESKESTAGSRSGARSGSGAGAASGSGSGSGANSDGANKRQAK